MTSLTAMRCSRSISLLCVLGLLLGCESGQTVVKVDRIIEKPVPVVQPIDARLTQDCAPATSVPQQGPLTVRDLSVRLEAVEFALDLCRHDKAELRKVNEAAVPR